MSGEAGCAPEIAPCVSTPEGIPGQGRFFAPADCLPPADRAADCTVLLPSEGEERARELLGQGHAAVLLGDAALRDAELVARLAAEFGSERTGVLVPVKRMQVSWVMDAVSNADFRFMHPSICEPCWEILTSGGQRTGTLASWWMARMFERGAGLALLRADIGDDIDLNLCASLVEEFGDRLWLSPLTEAEPALEDWVRWGHAPRLALPQALYDSNGAVLAWRDAAAAPREQAA
ncbi:MAG: hypothetical protein OHK0026_09760 [Rhodocyclaceae bacterium]